MNLSKAKIRLCMRINGQYATEQFLSFSPLKYSLICLQVKLFCDVVQISVCLRAAAKKAKSATAIPSFRAR